MLTGACLESRLYLKPIPLINYPHTKSAHLTNCKKSEELPVIQMGHLNVKQQNVVSVFQHSILLLRRIRFGCAKVQANSNPVLAASPGLIQGEIHRYSCRRSVPCAGDPPNLIFSTSRIALPPLKTMTLPVDSLTVTAVALVTAVIPAAA